MTTVTVRHVDADQADDALAPPGTAIVRPLRHVRAVRERHLLQFANPTAVAASRAARAWSWALGETALAPVTDRQTAAPPDRTDIETEIVAADERRLRGDQENRADAAATILRWLIGDDDHVPVRCENPGELVGGFGHIVRTRQHIADLLATATEGQCRAATLAHHVSSAPDHRQRSGQDADYLSGVAAALSWVLGEAEAPITHAQSKLTIRNIKTERLHAEDLIEQAASPWLADGQPSPWYGEGVRSTIAWMLGDRTASPVDPESRSSFMAPGCGQPS